MSDSVSDEERESNGDAEPVESQLSALADELPDPSDDDTEDDDDSSESGHGEDPASYSLQSAA